MKRKQRLTAQCFHFCYSPLPFWLTRPLLNPLASVVTLLRWWSMSLCLVFSLPMLQLATIFSLFSFCPFVSSTNHLNVTWMVVTWPTPQLARLIDAAEIWFLVPVDWCAPLLDAAIVCDLRPLNFSGYCHNANGVLCVLSLFLWLSSPFQIFGVCIVGFLFSFFSLLHAQLLAKVIFVCTID